MVKPSKYLPPDPRPWTANPQSRKTRKEMEKDNGGFDWGQALALGFIGATVVFGIDKSLSRCEERHEEENKRDERRRHQRQSRSQPRRRSQDRDRSDYGSEYYRDYDRDDDDGKLDYDEREYRDRYYDEREADRAARDYSREPVRDPEDTLPVPRAEREYARQLRQFDRDYGYGDGYGRRERYDERDDRKRSRSNPASRSRDYDDW